MRSLIIERNLILQFIMQHRKEIGSRIKKLRQKHNFSQTYVANKLFISQAAYSLIESSQNGIVSDHIIKLSKLYNVTTDYILKGDEKLFRINRDSGFVPLLRSHAHAGFIDRMDDDQFFDVRDWYRIPGFDPVHDQRLFEVDGDSMVPTILSGDILICQDHKNVDNILDGSPVVIITYSDIVVKRLRKTGDSEYLFLENDNVNYTDEKSKLSKDDVQKIMMIRGKISSVLIPHHEIATKGKIQALEEALEHLKTELFNMGKKLNALSSKGAK